MSLNASWRSAVFAVVSIASVLAVAALRARSAQARDIGSALSPSAVVRVGANAYKIPLVYFISPPASQEEEQHVALGFQLPAFEPLQPRENTPGSGASVITVLLQTAVNGSHFSDLPADPMDRAFYAYAEGASRTGVFPEVEDLKQITGKYGQIALFREDKVGKLDVFIVCSRQLLPGEGPRPRSSRFPGCDHFFQSGRLIAKLHYDRSWLPRWRETQSSTQAILDSFLIKDPAR